MKDIKKITKIMVIDTQGEAISDAFRSLLPGVAIRGIEPASTRGTPCHPHGAFCGWLAALPMVGAGVACELIFVRMFDKDARPVEDDLNFILDAIAQERPDYITRSWGAWDGDDGMQDLYGRVMFQEFVPKFLALQKEIGFVDFGAAGNSDENDKDNDVDYPQALLVDTTNIIGACDRGGVPTEWSGDGRGVLCLMWADRVYSPDMNGTWTLWSGTSAATPKACGACAALGLDHAGFRHAVLQLPAECRPVGEWELPHPKFGHGCAEDLWQNFARRVPSGLMPPYHRVTTQGIEKIEYFDFRRILDDERPEVVEAPAKKAGKVGRVRNAASIGATVMNRAIADKGDGWHHLAPFGEFPGVLERTGEQPKRCIQVMDRKTFETAIAALNAEREAAGASWRGLLVDRDHLSTMQTGTTEAMGRIMDLEIRGDGAKPDDGLYCKIDFTPPGKEAVQNKVYSFLSLDADVALDEGSTLNDVKPRIRIARLDGAALTNKPRLPVRSMNRAGEGLPPDETQQPAPGPTDTAGKSGDEMHKEMLCSLLGLPADASDAQIQEAMKTHQQSVKDQAAETERMKNRVSELEKMQLTVEAEKFCEDNADKITNRELVVKQYVQNKDATIALFGAVKAPTGKVLDTSKARTPATGKAAVANDSRDEERSKFIGSLVTEGRARNRSDAEVLAITLRPELFEKAG